MAKKNNDEMEQLRARIKEVESTNRVLRKRLKKLEGYHQQREDLVIEQEIEEEMSEIMEDRKTREIKRVDSIPVCPECNAILTVIKIAGRTITRCVNHPVCQYRHKATKDE